MVFVYVMVRLWVAPSESVTGIGVLNVASAEPTAALALRFAEEVKNWL